MPQRFALAGCALAACLLVAAGCATPSSSSDKEPAAPAKAGEPTREKMSLVNISPFDLAACPGHPLDLEPLSEEAVMGALLTRGPAFQECLLDAKSLMGSPADLAIKATVADGGVAVAVSGTGISEAGKACLSNAAKAIPFPTSAPGAGVSGQIPVAMAVKPVVFGVNAASDVAGLVRLAMPSMCSCFAEVGEAAPPMPMVKLRLTPTAPPSVVLDGVGTSPGMATCLSEKVKALPLPKADVEMGLPILLVNGWASSAGTTAAPAMQFQQLEAIRARRTAEVLIAAGRRGTTALHYDEVVKKFKAKPGSALLNELKTKCNQVLASDDVHLATLKALVGVYQDESKLVQAEKGKDPAWANVEAGLNKQLSQTSSEVVRVEQQRVSDAAACPKVK